MVKLLKLGADHCGQCKVMSEKLKSFSACDVVELDIEAEENEHYADKFKIRSIPTMVLVDDNEEPIQKWVGITDIKDIEEAVFYATK